MQLSFCLYSLRALIFRPPSLSKSHEDKGVLGRLLELILTTALPLPGAPEMSVRNDTYGITRIPTTVDGARGREKSGSSRQHTVRLSRFGPQGCVKPYSCFGGFYICVLELAMGREELQKAESFSWSPRASFYRKRGCHSGTQEVEREQ